ncbi:hypothetical protein DIPPA_19470 [Diplonema papillatum]|nr:hypothetical protein DIPPA_19470 [Diplonema papillatum]|eukprot:gene3386-5302_t
MTDYLPQPDGKLETVKVSYLTSSQFNSTVIHFFQTVDNLARSIDNVHRQRRTFAIADDRDYSSDIHVGVTRCVMISKIEEVSLSEDAMRALLGPFTEFDVLCQGSSLLDFIRTVGALYSPHAPGAKLVLLALDDAQQQMRSVRCHLYRNGFANPGNGAGGSRPQQQQQQPPAAEDSDPCTRGGDAETLRNPRSQNSELFSALSSTRGRRSAPLDPFVPVAPGEKHPPEDQRAGGPSEGAAYEPPRHQAAHQKPLDSGYGSAAGSRLPGRVDRFGAYAERAASPSVMQAGLRDRSPARRPGGGGYDDGEADRAGSPTGARHLHLLTRINEMQGEMDHKARSQEANERELKREISSLRESLKRVVSSTTPAGSTSGASLMTSAIKNNIETLPPAANPAAAITSNAALAANSLSGTPRRPPTQPGRNREWAEGSVLPYYPTQPSPPPQNLQPDPGNRQPTPSQPPLWLEREGGKPAQAVHPYADQQQPQVHNHAARLYGAAPPPGHAAPYAQQHGSTPGLFNTELPRGGSPYKRTPDVPREPPPQAAALFNSTLPPAPRLHNPPPGYLHSHGAQRQQAAAAAAAQSPGGSIWGL